MQIRFFKNKVVGRTERQDLTGYVYTLSQCGPFRWPDQCPFRKPEIGLVLLVEM